VNEPADQFNGVGPYVRVRVVGEHVDGLGQHGAGCGTAGVVFAPIACEGVIRLNADQRVAVVE
jgi:hypothetical protein